MVIIIAVAITTEVMAVAVHLENTITAMVEEAKDITAKAEVVVRAIVVAVEKVVEDEEATTIMDTVAVDTRVVVVLIMVATSSLVIWLMEAEEVATVEITADLIMEAEVDGGLMVVGMAAEVATDMDPAVLTEDMAMGIGMVVLAMVVDTAADMAHMADLVAVVILATLVR